MVRGFSQKPTTDLRREKGLIPEGSKVWKRDSREKNDCWGWVRETGNFLRMERKSLTSRYGRKARLSEGTKKVMPT